MTNRCSETLDLFGSLMLPERITDLCYSSVPDLVDGIIVCLTGYFSCARDNIKRVEAMQARLNKLGISVTEGWSRDIDILVVGDRATIVSFKIKNAIKFGIPIVKECALLESVGFYN